MFISGLDKTAHYFKNMILRLCLLYLIIGNTVIPGTRWSPGSTQTGYSRCSTHHMGDSIRVLEVCGQTRTDDEGGDKSCLHSEKLNLIINHLDQQQPIVILTQYDLRGTVVPRGHDGAVVLVVKSRAAKVHDAHWCAFYRPFFSFLQRGNTHYFSQSTTIILTCMNLWFYQLLPFLHCRTW